MKQFRVSVVDNRTVMYIVDAETAEEAQTAAGGGMKENTMTGTYGMPGPGGSLGKCAVCGDTFLLEVLTGTRVSTFNVDGIVATLCAHKKCVPLVENCHGDWTKLPAGPLREAFEKAATRLAEGVPQGG